MATGSKHSRRFRRRTFALGLGLGVAVAVGLALVASHAAGAGKGRAPTKSPAKAATPAPASAPEVSAPVISADDSADSTRDAARSMAREALVLMHAQRWLEARAMLARAYELVPAPTIALLEGRALEQMSKLLEAKARYEVAARVAPDEKTKAFRDAASEASTRLEVLVRRLPHLSIRLERSHGDRRRPTVTLDGVRLEEAEWSTARPVDPGEHVVVARFEGGAGVEDHVLLKEAESKQVVLRLGADGAPSPGPAVPARTTAAGGSSQPDRTWAYVALGAGAVGIGTGVTFGVMMLDARSNLDRECKPGCPESARDDLSRFRTTRLVSLVGYGVGVVGVGAGATLFVLSRPKDEASVASAVQVRAGIGTIAVQGGF